MKNYNHSGIDGLNKELFNPLLFQEALFGEVYLDDDSPDDTYELEQFTLPAEEMSFNEFSSLENKESDDILR